MTPVEQGEAQQTTAQKPSVGQALASLAILSFLAYCGYKGSSLGDGTFLDTSPKITASTSKEFEAEMIGAELTNAPNDVHAVQQSFMTFMAVCASAHALSGATSDVETDCYTKLKGMSWNELNHLADKLTDDSVPMQKKFELVT
jgi:hypothetical protein